MKLSAYMAHTGRSIRSLSQEIGVSYEAVRLWRDERRMPRRDQMVRLMRATGGMVTPLDFLPTQEARQ